MFRHLMMIGLCLLATSCGKGDRSADSKTGENSHNATKTDEQMPVHQNENLKLPDLTVNNLPPSVAEFVREGYTPLKATMGDLNQDSYSDLILVLSKIGEDSTSNVVDHPEKRPLLIFLGQSDHTYRLAEQNDNVVYCVDCGGMMGDPFMDVVIKNGYFSVEHYGGSAWRWTRIVTFRYSASDKTWYLHKDGGDSFHASEPEKVESKVRTTKEFGKVRFDEFDIYKED